jgi:hypothetical protein
MTDNPEKKKRLTAAEKKERIDFSEREARTKKLLIDQAERANKIRSKDKEFHGLERELMQLQTDMLREYEKSKDVKHPRDVGAIREVILRAFFIDNKLLPQRYAISNTSVRVASTSGHLSNELDIVFYGALDSFTLMQRQNVYEVLPIECCYGAIQVKSKLTKLELKKGFENIASFKRLKKSETAQNFFKLHNDRNQNEGFGILFAYDTDMDWMDIVTELNKHAQNYELTLLPNAIFILSSGYFVFGSDQFGSVLNTDINEIKNIQIYGTPDRQGQCLYDLYSIVFKLLSKTQIQEVFPHQYYKLPLTAGEYSYEYNLGLFAEFGTCVEHGDFSRSYTPEKLEKVISWCKTAEPINWIKATDIAAGLPGDRVAAYERQPGDVKIYNPNNLPLDQILMVDQKFVSEGKEVITKVVAFDSIKSSGMNIFIPYYYQVIEDLVQGCSKCKKNTTGIRSKNSR